MQKENKNKLLGYMLNYEKNKIMELLNTNRNIDLENLKDHQGNSLVHLALFQADLPMLSLAINYQKEYIQYSNDKLLFSKNPNLAITQMLNRKNNDGYSAYQIAAELGRIQILLLLQKWNCNNFENNNCIPTSSVNQSLLHLATKKNQVKSLAFFIEHLKMDIQIADKYGNTCLHVAAQHGALQCMEYLYSKQANINAENKDGYTPLHLAIIAQNQMEVRFLLNVGVELRKTPSFQTPYELAFSNKMKHLFKSQFSLIKLIFGSCYNFERGHNLKFMLFFIMYLLPLALTLLSTKLSVIQNDQQTNKNIMFGVAGYNFLLLVMYIALLNKQPKFKEKENSLYSLICKGEEWNCNICYCQKEETTYHCCVCNRCVVEYDHHSPYLNKCIGASNRLFLFLFLIFFEIGLLMFGFIIAKGILDRKSNASNYFYTEKVDSWQMWVRVGVLCLFGVLLVLVVCFVSVFVVLVVDNGCLGLRGYQRVSFGFEQKEVNNISNSMQMESALLKRHERSWSNLKLLMRT